MRPQVILLRKYGRISPLIQIGAVMNIAALIGLADTGLWLFFDYVGDLPSRKKKPEFVFRFSTTEGRVDPMTPEEIENRVELFRLWLRRRNLLATEEKLKAEAEKKTQT